MAENIRENEQRDFRQQRHESRTGQTWAAFLDDLCRQTNADREKAEKAASSILCALEQRIQANEAKDLNAQLPQKLRELLVRCERHQGDKPRRFNRDEFLKMVCDDLGVDSNEAERLTRGVFKTVRGHVSEGEAEQVGANLPPDLRDLWAREV
ncbi:MAG: DUF2267 domain-containing protein [Myxococcaceae bacterium]